MRVLIVEDEQSVQMTMARLVKSGGYEVMLAGDALAAVRSAVKERPDLILLDLGLPAGGGKVVIERLHNLAATSLTPIIVVTGQYVDRGATQDLADLGCQTVLTKPVPPEELLAAIGQALGENRVLDGRFGTS